MCVCVCIYICICIYMHVCDKISGKVDKSNTYNGFSDYISFFNQGRTSSDEKIFVLVFLHFNN